MSQSTQTPTIVENTVEIDLNVAARTAVVKQLNIVLANEYILSTKTRNYHWNVTGPHFAALHEFFGSQYEDLNESVDQIAERIRSLGGKPVSTLTEIVSLAQLKEDHGPESPAAKEMVARLLTDNESVIRQIRTDLVSITKLEDAGTVEFLTGLLESQEKAAWMLRATGPSNPIVKA